MVISPSDSILQGEPPGGDAAAGGGILGWLAEVAGRPGVVETLLALAIVAVAVLVWLRLGRMVDRVRNRAALADYLLGVEQALAGDWAGARGRLAKVLEADPENHYARLLYGKVLAAHGEAAQAHKHHLYLQRAFGVESVDNDLQLARALAQVGRPVEAADAAERALKAAPQHREAAEFLFRMRLQAGDAVAAARAGRRLLGMSDPVDQGLRAEIARSLVLAGAVHLQDDDQAAAAAALAEARHLAADTPPVRLFAARLDAHRRGAATVIRELLTDTPPPASDRALPVPLAARGLPLVPVDTLSSLLPAVAPLLARGRWRCAACGGELNTASSRCQHCGAVDRAEVDEPDLFVPVSAPGFLVDAIEQNDAHIRRTVRAAVDCRATDDEDAPATARRRVLELGEKAVPELLASACGRNESVAARAVTLLQDLGPQSTPTLFLAAEQLEDSRLLPIGGGQIAAVVGRVVQGFDRAALPHVETLFASARPGSRKILIDYFLGLGDPIEFEVVLERFPPLEILGRLNKVDDAVLRRFLQAVPPQHFVAEVLLLEPTFYREEVVLAAIPGGRHPEVLERALVQRGPSRTLTKALLLALGDDALRPVALRVLRGFGARVLDHVLAAFVDRDLDPDVRARLAEVLAGLGPPAVERLCASFGPEPTSLDDEIRQVLTRMGDAAVPALENVYTRPGWVERLTVGVVRRRGGNRRSQIVRALATIGTERAMAALRTLRASESDPDLKLRLQQALHRLDEARLLAEDPGRRTSNPTDADDAGEADAEERDVAPRTTPETRAAEDDRPDDRGGLRGQAG